MIINKHKPLKIDANEYLSCKKRLHDPIASPIGIRNGTEQTATPINANHKLME